MRAIILRKLEVVILAVIYSFLGTSSYHAYWRGFSHVRVNGMIVFCHPVLMT